MNMDDLDQDDAENLPIADLTAEIVGAYVAHQTVSTTDLPTLIMTVGQQLGSLGQKPPEHEVEKPKPVVSIRRSVREDSIVCLLCGKSQKMLKRHLETRHELTPAAYRALFGLQEDYPLVAPTYAATRSALAKKIGLGRKPEPPKATRKRKTKKPVSKKKS